MIFLPIFCLELEGQCFEDPRGKRVLPIGPFKSSGDMTVDKCKNQCTHRNYKFAGVEFAIECWCGNDRPTLPAPDTDCSMPCSGDKSEMCGGGHRINVYQLGNPLPFPFPKLHNICTCDRISRRIINNRIRN